MLTPAEDVPDPMPPDVATHVAAAVDPSSVSRGRQFMEAIELAAGRESARCTHREADRPGGSPSDPDSAPGVGTGAQQYPDNMNWNDLPGRRAFAADRLSRVTPVQRRAGCPAAAGADEGLDTVAELHTYQCIAEIASSRIHHHRHIERAAGRSLAAVRPWGRRDMSPCPGIVVDDRVASARPSVGLVVAKPASRNRRPPSPAQVPAAGGPAAATAPDASGHTRPARASAVHRSGTGLQGQRQCAAARTSASCRDRSSTAFMPQSARVQQQAGVVPPAPPPPYPTRQPVAAACAACRAARPPALRPRPLAGPPPGTAPGRLGHRPGTARNDTIKRFAITGTDLGIMWDNGDPRTTRC